jgi:hypothetical protein
MMKDLWDNVTCHLVLTIVLLGWPLAASILTQAYKRVSNVAGQGWCDALYYSMATYVGVSNEEPRSGESTWLRWPRLIHRVTGILAWAYITAIFITTIA